MIFFIKFRFSQLHFECAWVGHFKYVQPMHLQWANYSLDEYILFLLLIFFAFIFLVYLDYFFWCANDFFTLEFISIFLSCWVGSRYIIIYSIPLKKLYIIYQVDLHYFHLLFARSIWKVFPYRSCHPHVYACISVIFFGKVHSTLIFARCTLQNVHIISWPMSHKWLCMAGFFLE
jgi:hypothetical protein